jgi:hypothetical protein
MEISGALSVKANSSGDRRCLHEAWGNEWPKSELRQCSNNYEIVNYFFGNLIAFALLRVMANPY